MVSLQTPLNPAQVEILKFFAHGLTAAQLDELRRILIEFRFKLLDEHIEEVTQHKNLTPSEVDKASKEHRRRP